MVDITPMILKMIGGTTQNRVMQVLAGNLPIPNLNAIPDLQGLMQGVISNGIGTVFQNPLGSALGSLTSSLSGAAASITALTGMGDLSAVTSALSGAGSLGSALASLTNTTNLLSGAVSAGDGQFGIIDVLSHASTVADVFGASVPTNLSLGTVLAPLGLASQITAANTLIAGLPAAISGGLSPATAVSQITSLASTINAAISGSNAALSALHSAAMPMAQISSVAANLVNGPLEIQPFLATIIQPTAMNALQSAVNSHMATLAE